MIFHRTWTVMFMFSRLCSANVFDFMKNLRNVWEKCCNVSLFGIKAFCNILFELIKIIEANSSNLIILVGIFFLRILSHLAVWKSVGLQKFLIKSIKIPFLLQIFSEFNLRKIFIASKCLLVNCRNVGN